MCLLRCVLMSFSVDYSCFSLFFFKQTTAYELRISDWSSDVCSSDLADAIALVPLKRNRVAVIADAQVQPAIFLMRSDSDRDRTVRTGNAIFYSIFNKRLKDQAWNAGAHQFGRNIYAGDEAIRKP